MKADNEHKASRVRDRVAEMDSEIARLERVIVTLEKRKTYGVPAIRHKLTGLRNKRSAFIAANGDGENRPPMPANHEVLLRAMEE